MASQINTHIRTGQQGERMAAGHLQQAGYTILHRNYRYKRAEVDIIAPKDALLVFVEVKTRATDTYGYPEEAVGTRKEALLLATAAVYIEAQHWPHEVRFDIVSVTLSTPPVIHHIEDAFH